MHSECGIRGMSTRNSDGRSPDSMTPEESRSSAERKHNSMRGPRCCRVRGLGGAAVFVVDAPGFFELVLKDDDAAGGLDRCALVDEFAGAGGDAQLVAGVAAVAAGGP